MTSTRSVENMTTPKLHQALENTGIVNYVSW